MNIVFTGLSGVPYKKRACDLRLLSFAEGFISGGHSVTILNRVPIVSESEKVDTAVLNKEIKIKELYDLKSIDSQIKYAILFAFSFFAEYIWFFKENKRNRVDVIHVYSGHFIDFVHYFLISRIIGAEVIYQYVELRIAKNNKGIYHFLNSYLVDNYGFVFFDKVISISDYITNRIRKQSNSIPILKVPPICDISYFDHISSQVAFNSDKYILFCGSANYVEPIKLIVDSYKSSKLYSNVKLYLVLSGSRIEIEGIKNIIGDHSVVFNNLPYNDLIKLYLNAHALLIPLRNSIEDIARFPNKICEYTASKGVIVTTAFGEVNNYFVDNYNALIATDFTVAAYTKKLDQLYDMTTGKIEDIKSCAYKVCLNSFDISKYVDDLDKFVNQSL